MGRPRGSRVRYLEIAKHLSNRIQRETWKAGITLPSYSELAEEFNTSVLTISRTLACLEDEGKISRSANGKSTVRAKNFALDLYANRVLLVTDKTLDVPSTLYTGIKKELAARNRQIQIICRYSYNIGIKFKMIAGLRDSNLLGVLLEGVFSKPCQREYSAAGLPVVLVDAPPATDRLAAVCIANEAAAMDAVQRLFHLGHRHIAFCRRIQVALAEIDPDSIERQKGFLSGLKNCGIYDGEKSILDFIAAKANHPDAPAFKRLFTSRPHFTAVLAVDSQIANKISHAAIAAGKVLPRDLAIAAFGPVHSQWAGPRVDLEHVGRKAVELLESHEIKQIRIPATWHQGSSLGDPQK